MAETFIDLLQSGLSNLGGTISKGYSTVSPYLFGNQQTVNGKTTGMQGFFPWLATPMGEGKNAASPLQLGLAGFGLWQQNQQFGAQLDEARKQYEYQKALTGSNFQNQATNWGNQSLFQAQSLAGFNPEAGAQRVADLNAAFNQINTAGNRIGVNNVVGEQQNALQKYNKLVGA